VQQLCTKSGLEFGNLEKDLGRRGMKISRKKADYLCAGLLVEGMYKTKITAKR